MPGKFVLTKGVTGKCHFNLLAANGQVIATSKSYNSREAALNGIESVKKNGRTRRPKTRPSKPSRGLRPALP